MRAFRIGRLHVCSAEQIIHADIIEIRKPHQNINRHAEFSKLIAGIGGLMNLQIGSQLLLCKVAVFAQIADPQKKHKITGFIML